MAGQLFMFSNELRADKAVQPFLGFAGRQSPSSGRSEAEVKMRNSPVALDDVIASRTGLEAALTNIFSNPCQASPFKVVQLQKLHIVLAEDDEPWNKIIAGVIVFCT